MKAVGIFLNQRRVVFTMYIRLPVCRGSPRATASNDIV